MAKEVREETELPGVDQYSLKELVRLPLVRRQERRSIVC